MNDDKSQNTADSNILRQKDGAVSVIVPAFNEAGSLPELLPRLDSVLKDILHEIIWGCPR